jgi:hypothetical protein
MNKKLKKLPKFKSEEEEREFWATHDSTEYLDWSKAKVLQEPLVSRKQMKVSLTLSGRALARLQAMAKVRKVSPQALANRLAKRAMTKALQPPAR